MKSTISVVETLIWPPAAIFTEDPITSSGFSPVKLKYPPSELNTAEATSGSFGS